MDWTCLRWVGELKEGSDPHKRALVWVRGETFEAQSEAADLWQPKWNEKSDSPCLSDDSLEKTQVPWKVQQLGAGV